MSKEMKGISIKFPEAAYDDLKLIVEHATILFEIAACISDAKCNSDPGKLVTIVSRKIKIEEEALGKIINALLQFHGVQREYKIAHEEFIIQLEKGFIKYAKKHDIKNAQEAWGNARIEIGKALRPDSPFFVLEKSILLAFAHQNIMRDVQLITDIRPVFNDEATEVTNMVVTHLLMLEYYDGESQKKLHLTIDAMDIKKLKELCDRAQNKISVLSDSFKNLDWAVSIIGGEEDDC